MQCLKHIAITSQNNITEVRSSNFVLFQNNRSDIQLQHIQLSTSFIRFDSLLLKFDPTSQCHSPPLVSNSIEILDQKDIRKFTLNFLLSLTIFIDHLCILMLLFAIAQILSSLIHQQLAWKIMLPNSFV